MRTQIRKPAKRKMAHKKANNPNYRPAAGRLSLNAGKDLKPLIDNLARERNMTTSAFIRYAIDAYMAKHGHEHSPDLVKLHAHLRHIFRG